jgi:Queuine tRNA-ribosyltransferase
MSFNLIVTCVSQKKARKVQSIFDPNIETGPLEKVFQQWIDTIKHSKLKRRKAIDLYKGHLWGANLEGWGIVKNQIKDSQLWILSAGYGLIPADEKIIPYDITFQEPRNGIPSIHSRIEDNTNHKRDNIQKWWKLLTESTDRTTSSIKSLIDNSNESDYFLMVVGKDYLDAVFNDLDEAIKSSSNPNHIAVLSNNVNDPLAKRLGSNWLYADSRFVNLPKANSTTVNSKIAKELLWHMFHRKGGLSWWSHENFNSYLKHLSSGLPKPKKFNRSPSSDLQVTNFIIESLDECDVTFSKLHRKYRDSGRACEYTRFKALYHIAKEKLKKKVLEKRPKLPVQYKKRNAKMLFFLPDWDDRVDPLYDFVNDAVTPNRDPYQHDTYHYELYGDLNCDGILVSKSVLENNATKKAKAKKYGIHKYLRLPSNVPVIGDCGAFNYITEMNPPYDTSEILKYYEDLGFTYGVSVDHLIVPGVLKRNRYLKLDKDEWIEISESTYLKFKKFPNTSELKSRKRYRQDGLFANNDNLILKEIYTDESERKRRYDLTIKNAHRFIKGHKNGNYSFIPIGAVQGWDSDSYTNAVNEYQKMGYEYIAIGGLVKSKTSEIKNILEHIAKIRKKQTKLHMFGVARPDAIEFFLNLGVHSVDSAGMLRQAWLSSSSNYYSMSGNHYAAIRIPVADKGAKSKKAIGSGLATKDELISLERDCLSILHRYDEGTVTIGETLKTVMTYNKMMSGDEKLYTDYFRTLSDKPWDKCPCKICRDTGIDVVIFRRNNRNRRRGFHNTWVYFKKFRELTDIA